MKLHLEQTHHFAFSTNRVVRVESSGKSGVAEWFFAKEGVRKKLLDEVEIGLKIGDDSETPSNGTGMKQSSVKSKSSWAKEPMQELYRNRQGQHSAFS